MFTEFWTIFRLVVAALALAFSLTTVLPAPNLPLWQLSIGSTEYGHWFAGISLVLLILGKFERPVDWASALLALAATGLFLAPTVRASSLLNTLAAELPSRFPPPPGKRIPPMPRFPSAYFRAAPPALPVLVREFATHDGEPLSLRFFRAQRSEPAPCVIILHTGGWNSGTADEFEDASRHLASIGYAVAAIDYRFAPRWPWPAQREDTLDALHFLRGRAAEFGLDPERFVLLGRSAGGQIAEAVAFGAREPAIRGVIALYAPADLRFAYRYARADDILNSLQLVRDYMGGTPEEQGARYDSASAYGLVTPQSPPTLLLHGVPDKLVWCRQSERFDAQLTAAGVPHYFVRLDWATHAFDFNFRGPGGTVAAYAIEQFLASVTR